jgi:hypothetical protein
LVGLEKVVVRMTWCDFDEEEEREDVRERIVKSVSRVTARQVRVVFDEVELSIDIETLGAVPLERKEYCVRRGRGSRY